MFAFPLTTKQTGNKTNASIGWLQTRHNRLVWKKILFVKLRKKICLFIRWLSKKTKQKQR